MTMKDYLLPAAVLILALTQVPGMVQSNRFNKCIDLAREAAKAQFGVGPQQMAVNFCSGGNGGITWND